MLEIEPLNDKIRVIEYADWVTGGVSQISYEGLIDSGAFGEVHKVVSTFSSQLNILAKGYTHRRGNSDLFRGLS